MAKCLDYVGKSLWAQPLGWKVPGWGRGMPGRVSRRCLPGNTVSDPQLLVAVVTEAWFSLFASVELIFCVVKDQKLSVSKVLGT